MILAGDIGGTNTRLAAFDLVRGRLIMRQRQDFVNASGKSFASMLRDFSQQVRQRFDVASFGVAGPVSHGRVHLTNLRWRLDERTIRRTLKIRRVALINDLVAHAEGISSLKSRDLVTIHRGVPDKVGNRAIIAPGTGLGEGGLIRDPHSGEFIAFASEGGHGDFSPKNDREDVLLRYMRDRTGRCSWEDLVSGPGLRSIYGFVTSPGKFRVASSHSAKPPTPAEISDAAIRNQCPASRAALEIFATLCLSEAGNLALAVLATGGVYIGGGIAPHILKFLRTPAARRAFSQKGPNNIREMLAKIPIHAITSEDGALFGAARYATRV